MRALIVLLLALVGAAVAAPTGGVHMCGRTDNVVSCSKELSHAEVVDIVVNNLFDTFLEYVRTSPIPSFVVEAPLGEGPYLLCTGVISAHEIGCSSTFTNVDMQAVQKWIVDFKLVDDGATNAEGRFELEVDQVMDLFIHHFPFHTLQEDDVAAAAAAGGAVGGDGRRARAADALSRGRRSKLSLPPIDPFMLEIRAQAPAAVSNTAMMSQNIDEIENLCADVRSPLDQLDELTSKTKTLKSSLAVAVPLFAVGKLLPYVGTFCNAAYQTLNRAKRIVDRDYPKLKSANDKAARPRDFLQKCEDKAAQAEEKTDAAHARWVTFNDGVQTTYTCLSNSPGNTFTALRNAVQPPSAAVSNDGVKPYNDVVGGVNSHYAALKKWLQDVKNAGIDAVLKPVRDMLTVFNNAVVKTFISVLGDILNYEVCFDPLAILADIGGAIVDGAEVVGGGIVDGANEVASFFSSWGRKRRRSNRRGEQPQRDVAEFVAEALERLRVAGVEEEAAKAAVLGAFERRDLDRSRRGGICLSIRSAINTLNDYAGAVQDVINSLISSAVSAFGISIPKIPFPELPDIFPSLPDMSFPFTIDFNNPFSVPWAWMNRVLAMVDSCWHIAKTACSSSQNKAVTCSLSV